MFIKDFNISCLVKLWIVLVYVDNSTKYYVMLAENMKKNNNENIDYQSIESRFDEIQKNVLSDNSNQAYKSDIRIFHEWLGNLEPNEENLIKYLTHLSTTSKFTTIQRKFVSISKEIKIVDKKAFRRILSGIRNLQFKEGSHLKQAKALQKSTLEQIVDKIRKSNMPEKLKLRNIAFLLLMYHSAGRVSEIVSLTLDNVKETPQGYLLRIVGGKTDKAKRSYFKAIFRKKNNCPVRALNDWINVSEIREGLIFRSIQKGGKIKKTGISRFDAYRLIKSLDSDYSCHSLRAGWVTDASERNESPIAIMAQTNHRSINQIANYSRTVSIWIGNAAKNA